MLSASFCFFLFIVILRPHWLIFCILVKFLTKWPLIKAPPYLAVENAAVPLWMDWQETAMNKICNRAI